ncbi:hypothetical protein ACQZV8_13660 [Magnetococcales bacterium HHB-1]
MAATRNRQHVLVPNPPRAESYTPHGRPNTTPRPPEPSNRLKHATALRDALIIAQNDTQTARQKSSITITNAPSGITIEFSLRVCLSYFIEPNPGRRGWKRRHRYASHGLRFHLKLPTESIDEFHKRLNKKVLNKDEKKPNSGSEMAGWFIGKARNTGSLHLDIWKGTAADLAERGIIGISPVSGWWKDQPKRDRSQLGARYALIVTIETDADNIDIWTPVAQKVGISVDEITTKI